MMRKTDALQDKQSNISSNSNSSSNISSRVSGSEELSTTTKRQRAKLSCVECRRRKQKCDQTRDRPCKHCARRYPPVECVYYDTLRLGDRLDIPERGDGGDSSTSSDGLTDLTSRTPQHELQRQSYFPVLPSSSTSLQQARLSPASREILQSHPGLSYDISRIFLVECLGSNDTYLDTPAAPIINAAKYGNIFVQVGNPTTDLLNHLPVETTRRNAELLHLFVTKLSPYMSSIDGTDPPRAFTEQWTSFMIQSPLVAYVTILSASYFQAMARKVEIDKSVDAIATKTRLIGLINEHIKNETKGVNDEVIASVMALSYNELIYSDNRSVLAHMSGLRSMIRTRGGIENISTMALRKLLARTDYQVACTLECDPFIHEPRDYPIPALPTFLLELDNPLLPSPRSFSSSFDKADITADATRILDDMRYITTSIHSHFHSQSYDFHGNKTSELSAKFLTTLNWIYEQLKCPLNPDLAADYLCQTCRITAIIYTRAIITRTPLSQSCTAQLMQQLWMSMWRVPLPRWKRTPGVFLWVLLVVNPFVRDRPEGRFVKGMIAANIIGMGLVDWETVIVTLKGFLAVQKWLEKGGGRLERRGGGVVGFGGVE